MNDYNLDSIRKEILKLSMTSLNLHQSIYAREDLLNTEVQELDPIDVIDFNLTVHAFSENTDRLIQLLLIISKDVSLENDTME